MPNKEIILKRLKEHWDYATSIGYNEDRFLGIWLYGSQNYNTANEKSDIDSRIIILPSFSDMCLKKDWISKELLSYEDEIIDIKDIRLMREMLIKQNINYIETLYTEYFILNPRYVELFNNYFIKNRELISHFDQEKTIKSISGQITNMLRERPDSKKNLYNANRLYYFLQKYISGDEYIECIQPKGEEHNFLWKLKYGTSEETIDPKSMIQAANTLIQQVEDLVQKNQGITSPLQEKALAALNTGTIEILKYSFMEDQPQIISKKDFLKQLTNAEERAYYSIVKEIGAEGNITISKLVEKNSISRPVYNNLFVKMKENNVASIVNMGMKGTYIKILEPELKAEASK